MPHQDGSYTGEGHWRRPEDIEGYAYRCGYCGRDVAPTVGWQTDVAAWATIRICPHCNAPSFFTPYPYRQYPGPLIGDPIYRLPPDVKALYDEARSSTAARAYTGAVMLCRTILMHVAVEKSADKDKRFVYYVNWLIKERYAPKGAEAWVDYIRERGNAANHEIVVMTEKDAAPVILFTEALLRGIYELPGIVPELPKREGKEDESGTKA